MTEPDPGPAARPEVRRRPALRSRLIPIVALALAGGLLLYAIVSISVGEGGPDSLAIDGEGDVQQLYGGIPQEGNRLGSDDAPVTISVFNDVQCAPCADWQAATMPPLVEGLVRPGDAALELRHFSTGPRETVIGAFGATAAGEQGAQWQYAELLLRNLDQVPASGIDDRFLEAVAGSVPGPEFDGEQWSRDRNAPGVEAAVEADSTLAAELGLPAQPAVLVDGPGGTIELTESPSLAEIEAAVAEVR